jgi:hypothetical protein
MVNLLLYPKDMFFLNSVHAAPIFSVDFMSTGGLSRYGGHLEGENGRKQGVFSIFMAEKMFNTFRSSE